MCCRLLGWCQLTGDPFLTVSVQYLFKVKKGWASQFRPPLSNQTCHLSLVLIKPLSPFSSIPWPAHTLVGIMYKYCKCTNLNIHSQSRWSSQPSQYFIINFKISSSSVILIILTIYTLIKFISQLLTSEHNPHRTHPTHLNHPSSLH